MNTESQKTFEVQINKPSKEEADKLRAIIEDAKKQTPTIKPDQWVPQKPDEMLDK